MNVADQCRAMGLKVGDTISGREETVGFWHEVELTLLWLGESTVVWSERSRSKGYRHSNWSEPKESTAWALNYRDWKKVTSCQT